MGPLNEPVDVALAPASFGKFGGDLLVGNFGDGRIGVYQERTRNHWVYRGALRTPDQQVLEVNGLWGLEFGNGASAGPREALYFTAGPHTWHDETEVGGLGTSRLSQGRPGARRRAAVQRPSRVWLESVSALAVGPGILASPTAAVVVRRSVRAESKARTRSRGSSPARGRAQVNHRRMRWTRRRPLHRSPVVHAVVAVVRLVRHRRRMVPHLSPCG
jgi:hypothetical protein